ncbi:hypothetical protein FB451DRAFT_1399021 [Mycena latifolia]|nr:hypothetical protein FB451DRAFT_1399021 [Mycena latifolia]
MLSAPEVLSDTKSKAFKKEALRTKGQATSRGLKIWLDHQRFPPKPPGPPRKSYYEVLRGELDARKARVGRLMELRARALEQAKRRWPRPPAFYTTTAPSGKGGRGKAKGGKGGSVGRDVLRAEAEAEAAREVRVARLVALRTARRK